MLPVWLPFLLFRSLRPTTSLPILFSLSLQPCLPLCLVPPALPSPFASPFQPLRPCSPCRPSSRAHSRRRVPLTRSSPRSSSDSSWRWSASSAWLERSCPSSAPPSLPEGTSPCLATNRATTPAPPAHSLLNRVPPAPSKENGRGGRRAVVPRLQPSRQRAPIMSSPHTIVLGKKHVTVMRMNGRASLCARPLSPCPSDPLTAFFSPS